jgi:anti-sigma regulatory factor (Ser/Thr protein kinase)
VITRRQVRAVLGDGARVVDPAGLPVGRIVDVVLDELTSQPAWMTVDCQVSGTEVVVPLARAGLVDGCIQVPYTAADVCAAPPVDGSADHLDRWLLEECGRYYAGLHDAGLHDAGLHDADFHGAGLHDADFHGAGTPPGVPPLLCDVHGVAVLPVLRGLEVRTGGDSPVAYPPTSSGPWPVLSSSSPGPPWWQRRQWRWPSAVSSIRVMRLALRPVLDLTGLPDDDLEDLVLAAGEAATNAVEHARSPQPPFLDVLTEVGAGRARIVVQDHGRWRRPTGAGDRGRGLQLIGSLADATLTVGPRGTTMVLCNRLGTPR